MTIDSAELCCNIRSSGANNKLQQSPSQEMKFSLKERTKLPSMTSL